MCAIVTRFTAIPPESLQMSLLFGSVVKAATEDSQLKCDGFDVLVSFKRRKKSCRNKVYFYNFEYHFPWPLVLSCLSFHVRLIRIPLCKYFQ